MKVGQGHTTNERRDELAFSLDDAPLALAHMRGCDAQWTGRLRLTRSRLQTI